MADLLARLQAALVDRYTIERELGRGGMATVYLANDLRHHRQVAIKVLRPDLAAALGPERFLREIETAARLQHPHILPLHDSGDADGFLYYVMPYVEGESLRQRLVREKQLPLEDALQITGAVASALSYAHSHDVVHRDIKPENILLSGGEAVVADFGIARAVTAAGGDKLTMTGIAVGTPTYMSPEQAAGGAQLDGRSDVYSLGCVLYEMLAGEPPFTGPTAQAIIARTLTETPRPIHPMRAGVPEALDPVIAKAMAVTPADRYTSAAEFARAFGPVTGGMRTVAAPGVSVVRQFAHQHPLFARLAVGFLLGLGVLFAWRRTHIGGEGAGPTRIAVLPLENLGAPADEYFADGVTDEVRGKLTTLPGLQVTARGSSIGYKRTTKSPQQIGQELGVQYLLTGTVRWEKGPGAASRVHVSPELVQVSSGASKWQAPFDAALTDVFQIQADIAGRVAQALDVALGDSTQRQLAEKPTQNLAAYDAFLRGEAASQGMSAADPPSLRRAVTAYEQAVALDSSFVEAWARLSRAHSTLYWNSLPTPDEAPAARRAAERASTLARNRPEGHHAWGAYYKFVLADNRRALAEYDIALALAPGSADLLDAVAFAESGLGRWDAARAHSEQAARLDPRSAITAAQLGWVFLFTRYYPEARQAYDRALTLAPANVDLLEGRLMVALAQGDLAGARAVLRAAPKEIDPTAIAAFLANYVDLMWVLDDAQQALLLRLGPSAFDNDRAMRALVFAETYSLRGDGARARLYADSARLGFEEQVRATPDNAVRHVLLGLALAYLGRKVDAIREGERGVALGPISQDALNGAYYQHQLGRIYILVGEPEKALDQLEPLFKIPYYLSPGWLKIDPNFDPLRGNPRFERLIAGH